MASNSQKHTPKTDGLMTTLLYKGVDSLTFEVGSGWFQ